MSNLLAETQVQVVFTAQAAGATNLNASGTGIVDMIGFHSVTFLVHFGAITAGAVTGIQVEQSNDPAGSPDSWDAIAGSAVSIADTEDDGIIGTTIVAPQKRYLRLTITRATQNAVVNSAIALKSGAMVQPVTQGAGVRRIEILNSPAEGTA